uniref:PIH1 N-terminal domain-containing protein n=1 Tax=Stomoxys calcitrans TaxID=35570 RepID=A0A1I8QDB1_STOCA
MSNSFRYLTSADTDQRHSEQQLQELPCVADSVTNTTDQIRLVKVPSAASSTNEEEDEENREKLSQDNATRREEISDTFNNLIGIGGGGAGESNTQQLSPGLSLLQAAAASSPPPHSYRHSRAYRHFKNPPQPHMCIRTTTEAGEELFINVLSWTRIVIPQEPSDPIPLYGGMRVPPGSPRSPPIVFAVMANPEVLKDSGRHSKDPEERRAMVELMCDFVEAMNPGVKLVR